MNKDELKAILDNHHNWLNGNGGERANLRGADLRGAYLSGADLSGADLSNANLRRANLSDADLVEANLSDANLVEANLSGADMRDADLRGANLSGADLVGANLRYANLSDAYLRYANLSNACMRGANLSNACLRGTTGNLAEIKSFFSEKYPITYTSEVMHIGCEKHAISDWWGFDDERIAKMDKGALDWWQKWKPVLQQIVEISPAKSTGHEGEMK